MFGGLIIEGNVYCFRFFSVTPHNGSFKVTDHPFKINFCLNTEVALTVSDIIPRYGLSLIPFDVLSSSIHERDALVDIIGKMDGIMDDVEMERDGLIERLLIIRLRSDVGSVKVAIWRQHATQLKDQLALELDESPILIFQCVRLNKLPGEMIVSTMKHCSRILFNPQITEVHEFRARLALLDVDPLEIEDDVEASDMEDGCDPLRFEDLVDPYVPYEGMYAFNDEEKVLDSFRGHIFMDQAIWRSLSFIHCANEAGTFIFCCTITQIIDPFKWWYLSCPCDCRVSLRSGVHYCPACERHVMRVIPRFQMMVVVADDSGSSMFVLSDNDVSYLVSKSCADLFLEDPQIVTSSVVPEMFNGLIGRRMLFQVEVKQQLPPANHYSNNVIRICDVPSIVGRFHIDPDSAVGFETEWMRDTVGEIGDLRSHSMVMPGMGKKVSVEEERVAEACIAEIIQIEDDDDDALKSCNGGMIEIEDDADEAVKCITHCVSSGCSAGESSHDVEGRRDLKRMFDDIFDSDFDF